MSKNSLLNPERDQQVDLHKKNTWTSSLCQKYSRHFSRTRSSSYTAIQRPKYGIQRAHTEPMAVNEEEEEESSLLKQPDRPWSWKSSALRAVGIKNKEYDFIN
ncbi:hypothetical protein G6F37_007674 [Rhizopus arrhizus]|nr:hypothetical protein G6F38_006840 [Rhizopus arrhizus]KAG1156367.1 hypothetical protein G6F37_007674 [Rhizopus arrhizus]